MLEKTFTLKIKTIFLPLALLLVFIAFGAASCWGSDQTNASLDAEQRAADKWGAMPYITNFAEYKEYKDIYELRDNPHLVLNLYYQNQMTGQLVCGGKVLGFAVPYSTEWSQPQSGVNNGNGGGSIPEPNGLYPSQSTQMDWVRIIEPDGSVSISQVEPNAIVTQHVYPCTPLVGSQRGN